MKKLKGKYNSITIWIITGVLVCLTGLLIFFFVSYSKTLNFSEKDETFDKYYVMITEDPNSSFWQSVYKSAYEAGKEKNVYVEMLSSNLSREFSETELMEIAIASKVDGIIVEGNESEEMTELIDRAADENIPVVTLFTDNNKAERLSFVGILNYNLGKEYGNLIIDMANNKIFAGNRLKVSVLMDANSEDSGQNMLFSAIQEIIERDNETNDGKHKKIELSPYSVDTTNNFSVEESVRNLFVGSSSSRPSIIVCLSEIATTSVYQAVVDYNEVGLVNILGYYDSDAILKGIERNVIYATVTIDTNQMGQYCIDALSEYYELGNTSQYFSADISVINKDNVESYREEAEHEN